MYQYMICTWTNVPDSGPPTNKSSKKAKLPFQTPNNQTHQPPKKRPPKRPPSAFGMCNGVPGVPQHENLPGQRVEELVHRCPQVGAADDRAEGRAAVVAGQGLRDPAQPMEGLRGELPLGAVFVEGIAFCS